MEYNRTIISNDVIYIFFTFSRRKTTKVYKTRFIAV